MTEGSIDSGPANTPAPCDPPPQSQEQESVAASPGGHNGPVLPGHSQNEDLDGA